VPYYRRVGDVPRKRHTVHRIDGGRLAEELVGQRGFAGPSALLYHRHSPSAIVSAEALSVPRGKPDPNTAVSPYHLKLADLEAAGDAVTGRRVVLANGDVNVCWVQADRDSELYRNAAGDELVFVHSGRARLETVFGALDAGPGDYVVVPASTTHRWLLDDAPLQALVLEANGHFDIPARYLGPTGQMLEGAPFSERDLRAPGEPLIAEGTEVPVLVRHRQGWARHVHACHPFDVVGWDGSLYPYALSIDDFEPVVGRLHQPPPVHQTFAGPNLVVCSFVPRLLDFDPEAVRLPYHHANTDSDEVLFYVNGDFSSRKGVGIGPASLTLHPSGFVHGPQPGGFEASVGAERTSETAVMVDTFSPLGITAEGRSVTDPSYSRSWL
jgi:homogentisate 1,2-dioxygenase